jgi:large subunit ribosomal protein L21
MYAIIESGGKQYKVQPGDVIKVEKLDLKDGAKVKIEEVLAISDDKTFSTGTPYLEAATVSAVVKGEGKGKKVIVYKYKSKKDFHKKKGHRQPYTELEIDKIVFEGKTIGSKPEKKKAEPKKEKVEVAEADDAKKADTAKEEKPAKTDKAPKAEKPEAKAEKPEAAPAEKAQTKADIMAKLDELNVKYLKAAKKDELLALLEENSKEA